MAQVDKLAEHIQAGLGDKLAGHAIAFGELTLDVNPGDIEAVLKFLRDDADCAFTQLMDVCGADYPQRILRFDVVYHLLSMTQNHRVRVKLQAGEETLVPSVTGLFETANWFEREAFDMYGILFSGHPDLRRLLTDYGFEGYPLRKDFPLTGHVELRYDDDQKKVVYEPVSLVQEFRDFDFESPWEGARAMSDTLPGDEKASGDDTSKKQES
ncbi:NADH-quinone oxidoreductase subunit C [Alphaproteobacteria bacterium]|nr:NADH-quinone oxidoreductase subunit C [Alphaproteobacteria bacterium]MDC0131567.1 NADH-quinone oxidoreductase subunit C [Alphaproteobacteria bacterium]MDC0147518.1 NADH-quinone oxidoreductase subunit C [Alphaproteobacteria bacterium]